jgi:hypothetical protein
VSWKFSDGAIQWSRRRQMISVTKNSSSLTVEWHLRKATFARTTFAQSRHEREREKERKIERKKERKKEKRKKEKWLYWQPIFP